MIFAIFRIELRVGKVGAEHQQGVAVHHRVIARRKSKQTGHADVIGIVVFDEFLAAQRMNDRGFQPLGNCEQLGMCPGAARATQNRDLLGIVQYFGCFSNRSAMGSMIDADGSSPRVSGSEGHLRRATSPGIITTATPCFAIAVRMAMPRTRGICSGCETSSQ